jgi:hypothetical protein
VFTWLYNIKGKWLLKDSLISIREVKEYEGFLVFWQLGTRRESSDNLAWHLIHSEFNKKSPQEKRSQSLK